MPSEPNQIFDAEDCLHRAQECRERADKPYGIRVELLKMADEWERLAKLRRLVSTVGAGCEISSGIVHDKGRL